MDFWGNGVVTDPLQASNLQEYIGEILWKCRGTIKLINKSSNLTAYIDKLKDDHGIQLSLSNDCKNRWNSTKCMIETVLEFKGLISQLHSDKHQLHLTNERKQKLANVELSSDDWLMIKSIEQVLRPFEKATELMSGQHYATIGIALYAIRRIKVFLESLDDSNPFINGMSSFLLQQIVHYIDDDTEQLTFIVVSILTSINAAIIIYVVSRLL
jgi:hypothetical protein